VSPIIATLLLIAISATSGILVYAFTNGLIGALTSTPLNRITEQLSADAYSYVPISNGVTIYVRNTGSGSVQLSAFYFDGAAATSSGTCSTSSPLALGTTCTVILTTTPPGIESAATGSSHRVTVVTIDGASFSFPVVAGQTS
jgi:hypothetical protein